MKRVLFFAAAVCVFGIQLYAQKAPTLPVDFAITLGDLDKAAKSADDRNIPGDALLVLNAKIGSVTVGIDEADRFVAQVELLGGAWHGEDTVDLYRAYAIFDGVEFRDFFSKRATDPIKTGDDVILIARYLGIDYDFDETTLIAYVGASAIRPLN